jgi:hypothetical protein
VAIADLDPLDQARRLQRGHHRNRLRVSPSPNVFDAFDGEPVAALHRAYDITGGHDVDPRNRLRAFDQHRSSNLPIGTQVCSTEFGSREAIR